MVDFCFSLKEPLGRIRTMCFRILEGMQRISKGCKGVV